MIQAESGFYPRALSPAGAKGLMIIAQAGFQANSRVITATDEILQDLVNMKR